MLKLTIISDTTAEVRTSGDYQLKWATLEKVTRGLGGMSEWVVRRFDWLDPSSDRADGSRPAVSQTEVLQLAVFLNQLNGEV